MKKILYDKSCKDEILKGIELMYEVVTRTMGPHGSNSLIDLGARFIDLTKDGVTVADQVESDDKFVDMGCKLVLDASQKTNEEAGDGTTSVILLTREMCTQEIPKNTNVISVKRGITKAINSCTEKIKKLSFKVEKPEDYKKVARTSCQDDDMAEIITEAFVNSGEYGAIDIERKDSPGISYEKSPGISFDTGWLMPSSVNDRRGVAIQDEVNILVTDKDINSQHSLVPILTQLAEKGVKHLCIVCNDIQRDAKGMLNANNQRGTFHSLCIKAPSYGGNKVGILKDIAEATGATFISEEHMGNKLETMTLEDLGKAKKVTAEHDKTIIVFEDSLERKVLLSKRIEQLKELMAEEKNEMERDNMKRRLASLTDGITTVKVEGHTQQEYRELRTRAEDAVRALQSTREEGAVEGCGLTYLHLIETLEELIKNETNQDEIIGMKIVKNALDKPAQRILEVAGIQEKEFIVAKMREQKKGYNFNTNELDDMKKLGVWDSTKSVRCCLEYSASVAKNFISLGSAIARHRPAEMVMKEFGQLINK